MKRIMTAGRRGNYRGDTMGLESELWRPRTLDGHDSWLSRVFSRPKENGMFVAVSRAGEG